MEILISLTLVLPEQVLPGLLQLCDVGLGPDGGGHDGGGQLPRRVLPLARQLVLRHASEGRRRRRTFDSSQRAEDSRDLRGTSPASAVLMFTGKIRTKTAVAGFKQGLLHELCTCGAAA